MHKLNQVILVGSLSIFLSGCISAPIVFAGAAGTGGANVAGSSIDVTQQGTDLNIKSNIFTILNNMKGLNGANIEVTVFNGIVLLLGQIPTQDLKDQLASQISEINGVVVVYNQLTVGPNVSFGRFADDTWITSKVKSNMVGKVNPLHFKVVTQQGVVYLLGQVTQEEGDQAAEVAAQTSGVVEVVKIFNYIAPTAATPTTVMPNPTASTNGTQVPAAPVKSAAPSSVNPAASAGAAVANPSSIPQYAPSYPLPDESVGPAASD